ncbi:MAG: phytanoyl-CoA dioxygenase family protein [Gammaproteobacteria bacterium]|nr:phytanoyl-CoA dioxygenase family protein [Gammaproteobacteria bacterium]
MPRRSLLEARYDRLEVKTRPPFDAETAHKTELDRDRTIREPVPYKADLLGSADLQLSQTEVEHFKREGFLVKRGLVPASEEFKAIVDYVWETVPEGVMSREDPTSWVDEPHERWPIGAAARIGVLQHSAWKMRSPHRYGREESLLKVTANHPRVRAVVKQFLGERLERAERVRGVYVVLPKSPSVEGRLGPHVDHSAAQLSAMVLIDEIPPRTGGFTVWPGSHARLHRYWTSCQGAHFNQRIKNEFDEEFKAILRDIVPVEFVGEAGDVVFWHPRLIHSAGVNYSAELNASLIRYAIPCDFQKPGYTFYDDDDLGPGSKHQWWVDTRHFREDPAPTSTNMWDDWSI